MFITSKFICDAALMSHLCKPGPVTRIGERVYKMRVMRLAVDRSVANRYGVRSSVCGDVGSVCLGKDSVFVGTL